MFKIVENYGLKNVTYENDLQRTPRQGDAHPVCSYAVPGPRADLTVLVHERHTAKVSPHGFGGLCSAKHKVSTAVRQTAE